MVDTGWVGLDTRHWYAVSIVLDVELVMLTRRCPHGLIANAHAVTPSDISVPTMIGGIDNSVCLVLS